MNDERLQPSASLSGDSGPALTSWKEIAQFFRRHVRTVQRWEREEGLPVHRHPHQKQSSVYAFPGELEAWWRGRSLALEAAGDSSPAGWRDARWVGSVAIVVLLISIGAFALRALRPRLEAGPGAPPVSALSFTMLLGSRENGWLASSSHGDFNGDGLADLALAADKAGTVYLFFGAARAGFSGDVELTADVIISGPRAGQWVPDGVGDVNGDGIDDLAVTHLPVEPESLNGSGTVYIVFGHHDWRRAMDIERDADVAIGSPAPNDIRMGPCRWLAGGTDVNGDGISDLLITASEYSIGETRSAGAIFAILGRDRWPATMELAKAAAVAIYGTRSGEGVGICATGDLDGDGLTDLVVGAGEDTLWNLLGGDEKIYVFSGRAQWPSLLYLTDADWKGRGKSASAELSTLAVTDLDGDGRDDVVTAWPADIDDPDAPGELRIWRGGERDGATTRAEPASFTPAADAFRPADLVIPGPTPAGRFGQALAIADLDRDGAHDLLVGAPGNGTLDVVFGGGLERAAVEPSVSELFREPALTTMWYEMTVADFNGDGLVDLVMAVPDAIVGASRRSGMAFVLQLFRPLRVDLRPDQVPNAVLVPHGVCAVRIYGESAGEPLIDTASIRFAGAAPTNVVVEDYDGDGFLDVQAYFDNAELRLAPGAERAVITARTRSGLPVGGSDAIVVVPNGRQLQQ